MRLDKGTVIIVALVSLLTGMHAALAKPSHRACATPSVHFVQTCNCHPKYDNSTRYRRRLLAGFETEYDVEKWEKAYRQGLAQWGSPSKPRQCGAGL
jgi:hypothetical protein